MKFGKASGGGGGQQTPEESQKWKRLANRFRKNGGAGIALDFPARVVGIKTPHECSFTKDGKKTITAWGDDTPADVRFKAVTDRQGAEKLIPMKPGVLITLELVEERFAGLRFYKEGTYSGNELTAIYQLGDAIYRGKLEEVDVDPEQDFLNKDVLITLMADKEHERTADDGEALKGGFWWKIKGFKPVPVSDDDDDDDYVAPRREVAEGRELVAAGVSLAAPLDDDEEAPFD